MVIGKKWYKKEVHFFNDFDTLLCKAMNIFVDSEFFSIKVHSIIYIYSFNERIDYYIITNI